MKQEIAQICEQLLNLIGEFYEQDSQARTFGTDTELYHSEIHMLQAIAGHSQLHISALARLLGITRGAASQTVKRLERKGMLVKYRSSADRKKVLLHLTKKGEAACRVHQEAHAAYRKRLSTALEGAAPEQLAYLHTILAGFEQALLQKPEPHAGKKAIF